LTPLRTGIWLFPDAPAPRFVSAVAAAEEVGLDEVWVGDEGPARDPFGLLAAAATVTSRIRLAVGVTNPYLRHPVLTASAAATVHELSGGRMVLGIGAGGRMALEPVGVRPARPLTDCRDALRLVRAALTATATVGYDPPAHALTAADLPVFVGARGEQFNRWASAAADGVFVAGVAPSLVANVVGWARSVRPISVALYVSACLDDGELEDVRPRMIHAFADAPETLRPKARLDPAAVRAAALALNEGDDAAARALLVDDVLDLVLARPADVVATCAALARDVQPASIGLALVGGDPVEQVERAAVTLHAVKAALR
jgi:5,10-methylenetetrahydromethanopterin reductase